MASEGVYTLALYQIPQFYLVVIASAHKERLRRMEIDAADRP